MTNSPVLSLSRRTRRTPFTSRVETSGVKGFTVYNRMLLPTYFESMEADYRHLKDHVQVWDVACERQIDVTGPDADHLMQMITPRNLSKMKNDQCLYIPVVDRNGGMLNDPVALKHSDNHWWISIADSDLFLWVKGIATGLGLDVMVTEPDVSPLAVQGPKSDELMARVFGSEIHQIKFSGTGNWPLVISGLRWLAQDTLNKAGLKFTWTEARMASLYGMPCLRPEKTSMLEPAALTLLNV